MSRLVLTYLLLHTIYLGQSQNLEKTDQITLPGNIDKVSIDQTGNLFLATKDGLIHKYSPSGDSLLTFSPRKNAPIGLLEASNGLRVFVFYNNFQEYILLDQFFRSSPYYGFDANVVGFAGLVAHSSDNNLWILDASNFSLKKYHIEANLLEIETPLGLMMDPDNYQVEFMKEYQNLLFISDINSGIYVFDILGNYKKRMPYPGIRYFNFFDEDMYFLRDGYIHKVNLYSGSSIGIPLPNGKFDFVLIREKTAYLLEGNTLQLYRIIPK